MTIPSDDTRDAHAAQMMIRYELLSLKTLKLAERAAEMAELCPLDEPDRFNRQMASVSKAIWIHATVERWRHGEPVSLDAFKAAFGVLAEQQIVKSAYTEQPIAKISPDIALAVKTVKAFMQNESVVARETVPAIAATHGASDQASVDQASLDQQSDDQPIPSLTRSQRRANKAIQSKQHCREVRHSHRVGAVAAMPVKIVKEDRLHNQQERGPP